MTGSTLTLTPNNRLEKHFIEAAFEASRQTSLEKPDIYSVSSFIQKAWHELQLFYPERTKGKILSDDVTHLAMWRKAVATARLDVTHAVHEIATELHSAFTRLETHNLSLADIDAHLENEVMFKKVAGRYLNIAKDHVTQNQALNIIISAIHDGLLAIPPVVTLKGFDDDKPIVQSLIDALSTRAILETPESTNTAAKSFTMSNHDDSQQLRNMAQLTHHLVTEKQAKKVMIVAYDLHSKRNDIKEALLEVFEPQYYYADTPYYTAPFNISLGTPMYDIPIIRTAVDLISLTSKRTDIEEVMSLLKSEHLATRSEHRYDIDKFCERLLQNRLTQQIDLFALPINSACPTALAKPLSRFLSTVRHVTSSEVLSGRNSMHDWFLLFIEWLTADELWPGSKDINSEEYQAMEQFIALCEHAGATHAHDGFVPFEKAVFELESLVKSTTFSPETPDCKVQVMGFLEASGMEADYIIVLDANSTKLPGSALPSPYLPLDMQEACDMPHCNIERELAFCKRALSRMTTSCNTIIYSYCEYEEDVQLECSPLISGEALPSSFLAGATHDINTYLLNAIPVENVQDNAVPVDAPETVSGGISLLKKHNACPFSAFLAHRLKLPEVPVVGKGLSAAERSTLLHASLDDFWATHRSQKTLLAMSETQLQSAIDAAVTNAINDFKLINPVPVSLLEQEQPFLISTLHSWMDVEISRPPFEVTHTEQHLALPLSGMTLNIRTDRIDNVIGDDGNEAYVPLDYKLTAPSLSTLGEECQEPGLPAYAIASSTMLGKPVEAVAFGTLKKGKTGLSGLQSERCNVGKGVYKAGKLPARMAEDFPDTWDKTLQHWQEKLEDIAQRYLNGQIDIVPSKVNCEYCPYQLVCRSKVH